MFCVSALSGHIVCSYLNPTLLLEPSFL
uniref:Uncharacterized protein n=1 Tax=Rhizophora mucronata TaxID=61149 RepID=A0A2P2NQZ6_RHIMU